MDEHAAFRRARSDVLEVERRIVFHLLQGGHISDATAQRLEGELDIETIRLHVEGEQALEWDGLAVKEKHDG